MLELLSASPWLLVVAIFLARIIDVSLGTLRTLLVFRGRAYIAALIGFVEVLIWITAASQVLADLSAWYLAFAYAAGFATGNIVGIWFESRLALGLELVRAVSEDLNIQLADKLRERKYSAIRLEGISDAGTPVEIVFVVEKRRRVAELLRAIESVDANAFCTISDVKRHATLAMANLAKSDDGLHSAIKKK